MKHTYLSVCCIVLMAGLSIEALGQKRTERGGNEDKTAPRAPKRTDRTIPESERVKVITKTEFIKITVRPNKGYLSVVAVPAATVSLIPLLADLKKATAIKEVVKNEDGSLNLINLLPGGYKISIEHEDYLPFSGTVQVDPARPDTFVAFNKMVSKYGMIRLGGLVPGAKIYLDDQPIKLTSLTRENQEADISRLPVGKHRLRISKEGYVDFAQEVDVLPGEQAFVSPRLELAQVTLHLMAEPGARVYSGSVEKASIPSDGKVSLLLVPGRHTIRVSKDGYQEWTRELLLSLANDPVSERVELIPIPSSAEAIWQPAEGQRKWHPQTSDWKFAPSGALVRGDKLMLFDTESNRDFNTYRDFKLEFDVVFTNQKGVAWVARAKDPSNYYLFEINDPQTNPTFHFYVCQNGKLELKDSQRIVEKLNRKGDSFHILFEARGNRFDTRLTIASAPAPTPNLIGIFQDSTFTYGGVGFRGKDQSEALLQTLFIIPLH